MSEEELYATKYELYLSIVITIIIFFIIFSTLYTTPSQNLYPISFLIIILMIVIDIYIYLSYRGKFPLYKVKRKE